MSLYDMFYDFFLNHVFTNTDLSSYTQNIMGVDTTMDSWLCHTCTIGVMILFVVLGFGLFRWIFRTFAGLINKI